MSKEQSATLSAPSAIYVWLVPSEHVLEQPGSWRIRKWDTEPFPEANYTLASTVSETAPTIQTGVYETVVESPASPVSARGTSTAMVDALNQWRDKWVEELPTRAIAEFDGIVP